MKYNIIQLRYDTTKICHTLRPKHLVCWNSFEYEDDH